MPVLVSLWLMGAIKQDYITDDNDHDGIEKFILGEQKWVKLFLLMLMEHY